MTISYYIYLSIYIYTHCILVMHNMSTSKFRTIQHNSAAPMFPSPVPQVSTLHGSNLGKENIEKYEVHVHHDVPY